MCGTLTQKFRIFILHSATSEPRRQLNEIPVFHNILLLFIYIFQREEPERQKLPPPALTKPLP